MADILVPTPGESITEVEIGSWLVENGSWVETDQEIASLESEKATLELTAPATGIISILVTDGEAVAVGSVIGNIDESASKPEGYEPGKEKDAASADSGKPAAASKPEKELPAEEKKISTDAAQDSSRIKITPVAKSMMEEQDLSIEDVLLGLRRISKKDIERVMDLPKAQAPSVPVSAGRNSNSKKMSLLRRKLAERLVAVKNETAMLTTFNEVDMSAVMELRNRYKTKFQEKHGVKLGFMSFFTQATSRALQAFPQINSMIDGQNHVQFDYHDIGIAVQTPKGLMVPVIRNVEALSLAEIEKSIADLAEKAKNNKISLDDLDGGTFSITNGGVFGSLLSTPIINPPQSSILGMHNIVERPIASEGQVVIRPMMYLALTYDHRLIDGKDSVGFLKKITELIENPFKLLHFGGEPEKGLFGL